MRQRRVVIAGALATLAAVGACRSTSPSAPSPSPSESAVVGAGARAATQGPLAPSASSPASPATPMAHDPAHPPIDCPLRAQGVDPSHLKPFEDVAKYIAFLDRPDRVEWQRPDAVVAALGLRGAELVVDLGAGSGYFTFPIAKALGSGKVVAIDVEPEMIRHVHHKAMTEGVRNVSVVLGKPDDPSLPAGADVVFMCDVLHHVSERGAWLAKLSSEMKIGARLVVVEFKEGKLPEGPPESVKLPRAELVKLVTGAGLTLESEQPDLLPYQVFLVFRRP